MARHIVLITGGAKRLGAASVKHFHSQGFTVLIHCHSSRQTADALAEQLNQQRAHSAFVYVADLTQPHEIDTLTADISAQHGQLDVLINNASQFYPTPLADASLHEWEELMSSNLKAPFLLIQACAPLLTQSASAGIVNMIDIYAERTLAEHPIYCAAKAGLAALTRNLARDLGPAIRVNGVAPGAILWPEGGQANADSIVAATPLKRCGTPEEIAEAVYWLATQASFITGHILPVDGGRSLTIAGN